MSKAAIIAFVMSLIACGTATLLCANDSDSPNATSTGISASRTQMRWPTDRVLPVFARPASQIDAIEIQSLTRDERIAFSALQGRINSTRPRLLLLDARAEEGRNTWVETPTNNLGERILFVREDRFELVAKYADEISGLVLYETDVSDHYRNLACTVAGLHNALPVTSEIQQELLKHGIELDVLVDLTKLRFQTPLEIYRHLHTTYWPRCTKRLIVSANPRSRGGDLHHTRDIAAATGAAVVWLDNRNPDERRLMRMFFSDMDAGNAIVLGWYTTERSGITTASEFGIGTLPADHFSNGSVYAGTNSPIQIPPVPPKPLLENKAYIALFVSDGDNIQYAQHAMRRIWDAYESMRGRVPINWTIAPGLADVAPGIMNYYYTTATDKECFVSGPSGMGYAIPFNTLKEPGAPVGTAMAGCNEMAGYTQLTQTYLERSGLRVITIWDDATPDQRDAYERFCPSLYGATVQNFQDVPSVTSSDVNGRVHFDKLVIPYAGSFSHAYRSVVDQIERWDGASPLFLSYQANIWQELKPDRIVQLQHAITAKYPDKVKFVRADHYFNLFNEANGLPWNLSMPTKTQVNANCNEKNLSHVTDGSTSTVWNTTRDQNATLLFDFGEQYAVSRLHIQTPRPSIEGDDSAHEEFTMTIECSIDGNDWTPLKTFDSTMNSVVRISPARAFQFLRMSLIDQNATISEIEVFGSRVP